MIERGEVPTHLRDVAEYPGVGGVAVIDDRAVELLVAATPGPPLEIAEAIGAMCDRLQSRQPMHAGALQRTVDAPVHLRGRGLHLDQRPAARHDSIKIGEEGVVGSAGHIVAGVPARIRVPADHVDRRRDAPLFRHAAGRDEVGGDGNSGIRRPQRGHLGLQVIDVEVALKSFPIEGHAVDRAIEIDEVFKRAVGVPPKGIPPRLIQLLDGAVFFLQPGAETSQAQPTLAFVAELIGHMPQR